MVNVLAESEWFQVLPPLIYENYANVIPLIKKIIQISREAC